MLRSLIQGRGVFCSVWYNVPMAYPFLKLLVFPVIRARWIREVKGLENLPPRPPFILASNHLSHLDGPLIASVVIPHIDCSVRFIAKHELTAWRVLGKTLPRVWWKVIIIPPEHKGEVLEEARVALLGGDAVGILPEGRTNVEATLLPAKTGVGRLALWTGLPVVPVGIHVTLSAPDAKALTRTILWHRNCITLSFGAPLRFPKQSSEEISPALLHETTAKIMMSISALSEKPLPSPSTI